MDMNHPPCPNSAHPDQACFWSAGFPEHHARMLRMEDDPDVLVDTVMWYLEWELWGAEAIHPNDLIEWMAHHDWRDREWVWNAVSVLKSVYEIGQKVERKERKKMGLEVTG